MTTSFSDSKKRQQIIQLLDPFGNDQSLLSLDYESLKIILDKKTNSLVEFKHEDYFKIDDIATNGTNRDDELALIKFHLNKKEEDIKKLSMMLRLKEDELYLRERNIIALEKKSKSPIPRIDGEFDQEDIKYNSSPSTYQSFIYRSESKNEHTENTQRGVFDSPPLSEIINGSLSEEEAILNAIQKSEKEANDIIDLPFQESNKKISEPKLEQIKITAEILRNEGKSPYYMLPNKPEDVTDELLDNLYNLLVNRNFIAVKEFFANKELPVHILRWIKTLKFNDTTLTQMLLSKPIYIHKCLRPYE